MFFTRSFISSSILNSIVRHHLVAAIIIAVSFLSMLLLQCAFSSLAQRGLFGVNMNMNMVHLVFRWRLGNAHFYLLFILSLCGNFLLLDVRLHQWLFHKAMRKMLQNQYILQNIKAKTGVSELIPSFLYVLLHHFVLRCRKLDFKREIY